MHTYPPFCANRRAVSVYLTLTGVGDGSNATIDCPGGGNVFASLTATRNAEGQYTATLRESHTSAKVVGHTFVGASVKKSLRVESKDVKTAKTIVFQVYDNTDTASGDQDLLSGESIDIHLVLFEGT